MGREYDFPDLAGLFQASLASRRLPQDVPDHLAAALAAVTPRLGPKRLLVAPLSETDMVDFTFGSSPEGSAAPPAGDLARELIEHALSYAAFSKYPGIRKEFSASLHKRTRLWEPVLQLIVARAERSPSTAIKSLMAGWFAMVHLSAPIDQIVDQDPMSDHWHELGPIGSFELVLELKDQILQAPLSYLNAEAPADESQALARGCVDLACACLTATIGSYLDVAGKSELRGPPPMSLRDGLRLAAFQERLVGWKCGVIYESLLRCVAQAFGLPAADIAALAQFGYQIGMAVQMLDDAGGIWGGGDDLKKQPVKLTFPIAYALAVEYAEREELVRQLHAPLPQRDCGRILAILDQVHALDLVEFLIRDRLVLAHKAISGFGPTEIARLGNWSERYFNRNPERRQ